MGYYPATRNARDSLMPSPGEHKTVQARILQYAHEVGWTIVPRAEAERRRVRARTEEGGRRRTGNE
jgi:hypothetical protein